MKSKCYKFIIPAFFEPEFLYPVIPARFWPESTLQSIIPAESGIPLWVLSISPLRFKPIVT
jgi:hypothetical protein